MARLLSLLFLFLCSHIVSVRSAIYDCFLFFNELDLLKVRFEELYNSVDKFVLVESPQTFQGDPKPLYFEMNKNLFEKYQDKIIYVCSPHFDTNDPWAREAFQRNQIMQGLGKCDPEDIIIVSDADEIVSSATIPDIIKHLYEKRYPLIVCSLHMYRFFLNLQDASNWRGSVATTYTHLQTMHSQSLRKQRHTGPTIPGGWHFTSLGGFGKLMEKINSFSHTEYKGRFSATDPISEHLRAHACTEWRVVEIDHSFPKFIQDNLNYFESIGFILRGDPESTCLK